MTSHPPQHTGHYQAPKVENTYQNGQQHQMKCETRMVGWMDNPASYNNPSDYFGRGGGVGVYKKDKQVTQKTLENKNMKFRRGIILSIAVYLYMYIER